MDHNSEALRMALMLPRCCCSRQCGVACRWPCHACLHPSRTATMKYLPRLGLRHVVFPLCTLALLLSGHVLAQQPKTKRPVQHSDYDAWRSLQGQRLSPDGKFIAYALTPQEGDGEVVIRHLPSGREARYPRG